MSTADYILKQVPERREILTSINEIIIHIDKLVIAKVGKMMGKDMILYTTGGIFKYGLASIKNHMSLHMMPIYANPQLHSKYEKLLDKAKFQKGCINFKIKDEMPIEIIRELLDDCSKVDMVAIMENYKKNSKAK